MRAPDLWVEYERQPNTNRNPIIRRGRLASLARNTDEALLIANQLVDQVERMERRE